MKWICTLCFLLTSVFLVSSCVPNRFEDLEVVTPTLSDTPVPSKTTVPSRTTLPTLTPVVRNTPTPTIISLLTNTSVPELIAHKWSPETVLIKLESGGGDGCCLYSYPSSLVLYPNGRIITLRDFEDGGEWRYQLISKVFTRQEMCSVLNTIDQTGFLYYDPKTYRPQNSEYFSMDGAGYNSITVNAWKSNSGKFFGLSSYLYLYNYDVSNVLDDPGAPIIPSALRDAYHLLNNLSPAGGEIYQPSRLGLVVTKYDEIVIRPNSPFVEWPFDEISLDGVENLTSIDGYPSDFFIIEGNIAMSIYDYFENSFGSYGENVRQDGEEYVVFLRPLLPYEVPQFNSWNILPDPNVNPPGFDLECFPSDGILSIPTPPHP